MDEIHDYRTGGNDFCGLKQLRDQSMVVIGMSATPMYTQPQVSIDVVRVTGNH